MRSAPPSKRHLGVRVAGVGVGVALLVLGVAAPASALLPTITSFSPTSGPAGCVIVITGTNFDDPPVSSVDIAGTPVSAFRIVSGSEVWATVAGGASGTIHVTNESGTATSPTAFTAANPGGCAPTVTSFTPTCGPAGTDVTISGTNLLKSTTSGGDVRFAPYTSTAMPVTGTAVAPTQISLDVPTGATDGPITVSTPGGTATSTATFDAGTCITAVNPTSGAVGQTVTITGVGFENTISVTFTGAGGTRVDAIFQVSSNTETTDTITATVPVGTIDGPLRVVAPGGTAEFPFGPDGDPFISRSLTLSLRRHLVAKGTVSAPDLAACAKAVPVKIQRRTSSGWRGVGSTTTSDTGAYRVRLKDKPGRYRARGKGITLDSGEICLGATSPIVRHTH